MKRGVYVRVVYPTHRPHDGFTDGWRMGWLLDEGHRTIDQNEGYSTDRKKLFTDKCELDRAVNHWQRHGWHVSLVPGEE